MRPVLAVLSVLLALAGCTEYRDYWVRPGGTEAAFDVDASKCDDLAVRQFPPISLGVPGYFPNRQTWCTPTSGGPHCELINPGYLPQARSEADTNAGPRDNAFGECMMSRGWHLDNPYAMAPPLKAPDPALDQALRDCERQFHPKPNIAWSTTLDERFNQCVRTHARELRVSRLGG